MKNQIIFILLLLTLTFITPNAKAEVKIFACEPEWGSLAKEIGKEHVQVTDATTASEDPHFVRARPGLISSLRNSDLLICSGLGLEAGWLPILIEKSGNSKINSDSGQIMAGEYITPLEVTANIDRSLGDIHPDGNPHIHLDPNNILAVAEVISSKLSSLDPNNSKFYQDNYEHFKARLDQTLNDLGSDISSLKNMKIISHHKSWSYLINWLDLNLVDTIEEKPGISPSPSHLQNLLNKINTECPSLIIRTEFDPDKVSKYLESKSGVHAIILPFTTSDKTDHSNIIELYKSIIKTLKVYKNVKC